MKTTLNLDETLIRQAMEVTGITEKTKIIHEGLRSLIARHARERLVQMAGSIKTLEAPRRRR